MHGAADWVRNGKSSRTILWFNSKGKGRNTLVNGAACSFRMESFCCYHLQIYLQVEIADVQISLPEQGIYSASRSSKVWGAFCEGLWSPWAIWSVGLIEYIRIGYESKLCFGDCALQTQKHCHAVTRAFSARCMSFREYSDVLRVVCKTILGYIAY